MTDRDLSRFNTPEAEKRFQDAIDRVPNFTDPIDFAPVAPVDLPESTVDLSKYRTPEAEQRFQYSLKKFVKLENDDSPLAPRFKARVDAMHRLTDSSEFANVQKNYEETFNIKPKKTKKAKA